MPNQTYPFIFGITNKLDLFIITFNDREKLLRSKERVKIKYFSLNCRRVLLQVLCLS